MYDFTCNCSPYFGMLAEWRVPIPLVLRSIIMHREFLFIPVGSAALFTAYTERVMHCSDSEEFDGTT